MASITSEISSMQNLTEYNKLNSSSRADMSDKDMFLSLMLQQMQNQDPTEPVSNEQWLSQLAQYSSLEQMTEMNTGINNLATSLEALSSGFNQSNGISQTLSLIGKEVDITDPETEKLITGIVSEATFEGGEGLIKVNDKYYSIGYVQSVREQGSVQ